MASAERDGRELIAVVLKSSAEQVFVDAIKLLDYGFENYDGKVIVNKDYEAGEVRIEGGAVKKLEAVTADEMTLSIPAGTDWKNVSVKETMLKDVTAPVSVGQKLGTLTVSYDGEEIGSVDLISPKDVMTAEAAQAAGLIVEGNAGVVGTLLTILKFIAIGALVIVILFVVFVLAVNYLYEKKKRKRKQKRRQRERAGRQA